MDTGYPHEIQDPIYPFQNPIIPQYDIRGLFNRASARECLPKFPIPETQILSSARSVEQASVVDVVALFQTTQSYNRFLLEEKNQPCLF